MARTNELVPGNSCAEESIQSELTQCDKASSRESFSDAEPSRFEDQQWLVLGEIVGISETGCVVAFELDGVLRQLPAFACAANVSVGDVGTQICLAFANGDVTKPILLGKILNTAPSRKLEITHPNEINLRCGKSTIQLKSDGTVAIRGTNVASRASQTNRIRGGNVQIN